MICVIGGETQVPISFACARCWKQKKKCDKRQPRCSRCASHEVGCTYSSQPPSGRGSSKNALEKDDPLFHYPLSGAHNQSKDLSALPRASYSPAIQFLQPHLSGQLTHSKLDDHLRACGCAFLAENADDARSGYITYFKTLHRWLPIICKAKFHERLSNMQVHVDSEFAALVLSIYLVTYMPVCVENGIGDQDAVYSVTKNFHSQLQSMGRCSITIIQAGMLIAIYEHGHALFQVAYLTIGSCARMGNALGIHEALRRDMDVDSADREILELHRRVWWGLVILERILAVQDIQARRPFASQNPNLTDLLPVSEDTHATIVKSPDVVGTAGSVDSESCEIAFVITGSYASTAQAAYLLSRVFDYITNRRVDSPSWCTEAIHIDRTLQAFCVLLLQQTEVEGQLGDYCAAYFICMSALFALHRCELPSSPLAGQEDHCQNSSRTLLTLESLTRIIIEIGRSALGDGFHDLQYTPAFKLYGFYMAALTHIELGCSSENELQWTEELHILKDSLRVFKKRWRIAGTISKVQLLKSSRLLILHRNLSLRDREDNSNAI